MKGHGGMPLFLALFMRKWPQDTLHILSAAFGVRALRRKPRKSMTYPGVEDYDHAKVR